MENMTSYDNRKKNKVDLYVLPTSPELYYSHQFEFGNAEVWHQCLGHTQSLAL